MFDIDMLPISEAPHPRQLVKMKLPAGVTNNFMLRKAIEEK